MSVEKERMSLTLTRPYLDGMDRLEEAKGGCWTCKHGLDEGQIWCFLNYPPPILIRNPYRGCDDWEDVD